MQHIHQIDNSARKSDTSEMDSILKGLFWHLSGDKLRTSGYKAYPIVNGHYIEYRIRKMMFAH